MADMVCAYIDYIIRHNMRDFDEIGFIGTQLTNHPNDMFAKRNLALAKKIKQLQESEEDLLKQKNADNQQETIHAQIIPAAQHILESYPLLTVEEKNRLWKLVLKKATIYRSPDDEVVIRIYPNLPT